MINIGYQLGLINLNPNKINCNLAYSVLSKAEILLITLVNINDIHSWITRLSFSINNTNKIKAHYQGNRDITTFFQVFKVIWFRPAPPNIALYTSSIHVYRHQDY